MFTSHYTSMLSYYLTQGGSREWRGRRGEQWARGRGGGRGERASGSWKKEGKTEGQGGDWVRNRDRTSTQDQGCIKHRDRTSTQDQGCIKHTKLYFIQDHPHHLSWTTLPAHTLYVLLCYLLEWTTGYSVLVPDPHVEFGSKTSGSTTSCVWCKHDVIHGIMNNKMYRHC